MHYEYKAIPAPTKGLKAKGIKTEADRFAHAMATTLNILGAEGWEYQRAETLPAEQREGLMGKTTVYQNILIFRRPVDAGDIAPAILPAPEEETVEASQDTAEETPAQDVAPADTANDEHTSEEAATTEAATPDEVTSDTESKPTA